MQHRIVRPAILSIVGAYSPFYIAAFWLPLASAFGGFGLIFALEGLLVGAWLSTISVLLLLDTVRHRIWGLLTAISYAIAFPPLFYYSMILTSSQIGVLTPLGAWPAIMAPLVGLVGGVWGFLWRSSATAATPAIVTAEAPAPSRFPGDKPIIPALLSIAGIAPALYVFYVLVAFLFAPPQPPPPGGEGPGYLFILLIPGLVLGAAILVLLPTAFSIFLLFNPRRHKTWGAALTVWYGLASAYLLVAVVVGLVNGASTRSQSIPWYTALLFTPFLGLAGGVWGFFWHTGVNPRAWTLPTIARTMRGQSARVMVGGLASLVCSIFASPVLAILPFVLVVGNIQLGRSSVRSRARGVALMGLVVASGLFLLAFEVVEYLNAWWEVVPRVAGLVSLVATFLAGSGLVWSIRGPLIPRWKRLSTTFVFVALVSVLVGSIFAYAVVVIQARQNLPKPNVTLTNIGGTYMENCGPSGSQTTTFNMTATLVNTGGFGVATLGYIVNGQQVASAGYYVHPNTQVTYSYRVTIHACYGAQPPTYTVVLLSEQAA